MDDVADDAVAVVAKRIKVRLPMNAVGKEESSSSFSYSLQSAQPLFFQQLASLVQIQRSEDHLTKKVHRSAAQDLCGLIEKDQQLTRYQAKMETEMAFFFAIIRPPVSKIKKRSA